MQRLQTPGLPEYNRVRRGGLAEAMAAREDEGRPVRVAVIGAGEMGTDLVTAIARMRGMDLAVLVDRRLASWKAALAIAGLPEDHGVVCESEVDVVRAVEAGRMAVVPDASLALACPLVDCVIDATGVPAAGAEYGLRILDAGKHLVMMNVEADVTIGAWLQHRARQLGLVYTVGAGDEPSSVIELYDFVTALGYPVVAAGKGKNNAFRTDAVPADYEEEAARRNMNPRMLVEFVDGSKTMVEMACIANATGLTPDIPGMHGPDCALDDLDKVMVPQSEGGILSGPGRVDFTVGKGVAPGVFLVADMSHPRINERMSDLHLGEGPYFTFYRPYHLTSLEVPLSAARAVIYGTSDMMPLDRPVAEVCAVAKRDLRAGETLDFIGETTYRSWTMRADDAREAGAWPVGLLHEGRVTADVERGALLTRANVDVDQTSVLARMRAEQDAWLGYT